MKIPPVAAATARKKVPWIITVPRSSYLLSTNSFEQLIKYVCLGVFAFIVDVGALMLLVGTGLNYIRANTISFLIANCINFVAGHYLVFEKRTRSGNLFVSYIAVLAVSIVGLLLNDSIMVICVDWMMFSIISSKILATFIGLLWNFMARKTFVYR